MGLAARRPDGTYRAWHRHAPGPLLQPGEVMEDLVDAPETGPSKAEAAAPTPRGHAKAKIDAALGDATVPQSVKDALAAIKAAL